MSQIERALQSQLKNIGTRTGRTVEQLYTLLRESGLAKHGEMRDLLKSEVGMGHGDANTIVTLYRKQEGTGSSTTEASTAGDALDSIYVGAKADLRPIHEKLMKAIEKIGDFEIAPKKAYVSLRRNKQFATIGPATNTRVEVGLNMRGVEPTERLQALPAGRMCQYRVRVGDPTEVDKELIGWILQAYESAG